MRIHLRNRSFFDPVLKGEYPAELVALLKTLRPAACPSAVRSSAYKPMAKSIYWGLTIISRAAKCRDAGGESASAVYAGVVI